MEEAHGTNSNGVGSIGRKMSMHAIQRLNEPSEDGMELRTTFKESYREFTTHIVGYSSVVYQRTAGGVEGDGNLNIGRRVSVCCRRYEEPDYGVLLDGLLWKAEVPGVGGVKGDLLDHGVNALEAEEIIDASLLEEI